MTHPDLTITHDEHEHRGRFAAMRDGAALARMTYSRGGPTLVIIDHTEVDPALRGLGVGRMLLDALVTWARETHTKVMATCPFAVAEFERDPTLSDVRL